MSKYVFDLEGNGFLDTIDKVWCLVMKDITTGEVFTYSDHSTSEGIEPLAIGLERLSKAEIGICHNVILYDMLVLDKLYPQYDFSRLKLIDTLIWSQLQNFNRPLRFSWGKHSLEVWGQHFGRHKPAQEQWTKFDEHMLFRCEEDVEINYLVYRYLLNEKKEISMSGDVIAREMYAAIVSQQQVKNGWELNVALANKHITTLDSKVKSLADKIEPNLPQRLIKPSTAATWEEVNNALGHVFKRVPVTRHDIKGKALKPAKLPTICAFTKARHYHSHIAKWFDITPASGKDEATRLVDGPFTRIKWETSKMSQHAQVKKFLFTQGWVPTTWNFKKDEDGMFIKDSVGRKIKTTPKLTEDSFDTIKGSLGKEVATYNTYANRRNVIANKDHDDKGWLNNLNSQGRLICYPRTIGAATARMTHSGIVNVPGRKALFGKEMRQLFVASSGKIIVACDMASAQLRLLAAAMKSPDYLKTVITGSEHAPDGSYIGTDIHSVNGIAAGLLDPHAQRGSGIWKNGEEGPSEEWLEGRAQSKTFIYAFLFGAGDAKIGSIIGGDAEAGRRLKAKFFKGFPALATLIDRLKLEWSTNKKKGDGWFTGLDGRRIYCNSPHKILNYKLQSDEAILLKQWLINVDNSIKTSNEVKNASLLLSYHDELNYETIPEEADALGKILKAGIQDAGKQFGIGIMDGDYKTGPNWAEVH